MIDTPKLQFFKIVTFFKWWSSSVKTVLLHTTYYIFKRLDQKHSVNYAICFFLLYFCLFCYLTSKTTVVNWQIITKDTVSSIKNLFPLLLHRHIALWIFLHDLNENNGKNVILAWMKYKFLKGFVDGSHRARQLFSLQLSWLESYV
jgi:hypothetical protein